MHHIFSLHFRKHRLLANALGGFTTICWVRCSHKREVGCKEATQRKNVVVLPLRHKVGTFKQERGTPGGSLLGWCHCIVSFPDEFLDDTSEGR
jgi:hypothetical protein